jgi:phosphatidylglycerophosphate synthase
MLLFYKVEATDYTNSAQVSTIGAVIMKHLPNFLSLSRIVISPLSLTACLTGHWTAGFWLFVAAAVTDFIDGPLARKLNAVTPLGSDLDRYGDITLGLSACCTLIFAGKLYWYGLWILASIGAGWAMARLRRSAARNHSAAANEEEWMALGAAAFVLSCVLFALYLAAQAFGIQWWQPTTALGVLVIIAFMRRDRLKF